MAIFSKKESKDTTSAKAVSKKKVNAKDKPVKDKKANKPKSDAGANLTKAPGRILIAPHITEKAMQMTVNDTYVFEVAMDATKRDVVTAIKTLYKVTPRKVNIVRKSPRAYVSRMRNRRGTKSGMKKAYVFLKKGDKIDIVQHMKKYRPTTASRRHMTTRSYKDVVTKTTPHKSLTKGGKRAVGRNSQGRITSRHKGGGHKRRYREIDFKFDKHDIPAKVETIEYDPNRSAYIALVCYRDGERRYVIAHREMKAGDEFVVSENAKPEVGARMPLREIPIGLQIYNVETRPGAGARLARSAGNSITILAQDGTHTHVKMPSSEVRKLNSSAWASIGVVSNEEHQLITIGKAGRSRWLGKRPTVRGNAMNPVDHPHGGGEGRQGRGHRRQRNIFGKPTGKGQKTRKPKKYSNQFIVTRRKVGKRKK